MENTLHTYDALLSGKCGSFRSLTTVQPHKVVRESVLTPSIYIVSLDDGDVPAL